MPQWLWTQRQDIGPAGHAGAGMAFDPVRGKMVFFGGDTPNPGTWEWDGQFWTQVSDMGPGPRHNFGMAWDSASKSVMLFGGAVAPGGPSIPTLLGDTWEWDGEDWTQVADTGPAARFGLAVANDSSRGRIVLFGGLRYAQNTPEWLSDTWEWDGAAWTQQSEKGPSSRSGHSMAFDTIRARTVLFGGAGLDFINQGDTWEWDGTMWVRVSEFGPVSRTVASLCFDGSETVLFGGSTFVNQNVLFLGDTWSFDGRFWTQRQDLGPGPRANHVMDFDIGRKKVVLFGGQGSTGSALNDTWELPGAALPA
jgi:hypothetical protein